MNVSSTIVAKSDQLNADDLVGGPIICRIERVEAGPAARAVTAAPTLAIFTPSGGKLVIDGETVQMAARDTVIAEGAAAASLASSGLSLAIGLFPI